MGVENDMGEKRRRYVTFGVKHYSFTLVKETIRRAFWYRIFVPAIESS
jgi:hypothetical protein